MKSASTIFNVLPCYMKTNQWDSENMPVSVISNISISSSFCRLPCWFSPKEIFFFFFPCFFCGSRQLLSLLSCPSSLWLQTGVGGSGHTDSCRFFSDFSSDFLRELTLFSLPLHSTFDTWRDTVTSWCVWFCFLCDLQTSSGTSACLCFCSSAFLRWPGLPFTRSLMLFVFGISCFRLSSDSCLFLSTSLSVPLWWTPLTFSQPLEEEEAILFSVGVLEVVVCLAFSAAWKESIKKVRQTVTANSKQKKILVIQMQRRVRD